MLCQTNEKNKKTELYNNFLLSMKIYSTIISNLFFFLLIIINNKLAFICVILWLNYFFFTKWFVFIFFSVSLPIKRKNVFKRNIITTRNMFPCFFCEIATFPFYYDFIFLSFSQSASIGKTLALLVCLEWH